MELFDGSSQAEDAALAVVEATSSWAKPGSLDIIFAFCSTAQDPGEVAKALAARFPGTPIAGCTTSGEHLNGAHKNGSLVVMGIRSPQVRWAVQRVDGLADFDEARAQQVTDELFAQLGCERDQLDPNKLFSLLFVDGLSLREEGVASALADALEGIPLLGGSAGDDLKFQQTQVLTAEGAKTDAAVVVIGRSEQPFEIVKHQHFTTTPRSLAITKADPATRCVYEMDGEPAARAYARALGLRRDQLDETVCFSNPLTFVSQDQIFVRSIQRIEDDDSIVFYCAIEEGMVVDIASHHEMTESLRADLEHLGKARLMIGYNCILRALEASEKKCHDALGQVLNSVAERSIGFDTYGEQLGGLHINQTLVALAFFDPGRTGTTEEAA